MRLSAVQIIHCNDAEMPTLNAFKTTSGIFQEVESKNRRILSL